MWAKRQIGRHKARDGAEAPERLPPEGGTPTRGFTDTETSPSEYRLQPEACEGLQARVHGSRALCRVKRLPATARPRNPWGLTRRGTANRREWTRMQSTQQRPMRTGSLYRAKEEHEASAGARPILSARGSVRLSFYSGACSASDVPPNWSFPPQAARQTARVGASCQHRHSPSADPGQAGMPVPPCPHTPPRASLFPPAPCVPHTPVASRVPL